MSSADPRDTAAVAIRRWKRSWPVRYGFAGMMVAIATALELSLQLLGPFRLAYILYYPAVMVVAMLSGFWPGVVASLLATVSGSFFFLQPRNSFAIRSAEDLVGPTLFSIIAILLTYLTCSRTETKEALEESEADLKRAQAVAHIGSWRVDIPRNTMTLSDETYRIMGLPAGERVAVEQTIAILHPDDRERVLSEWAATLETGRYEGEERVLVQGKTRWVHIQAAVEFDSDGRAVAAVGTVQDITEPKRAKERLSEFERVVEGLEEMIVVVDRDYRYVIANRAFLTYRGINREQVVGHRVGEVVFPEIFEATVKEKMDECFQGKIVQYELRYKYPSLGERDLFISYFPIEGPGGVERLAAVLQDVTEKKQADHSLTLFRALIDQSNDAVEVLDPETLQFLDINKKACTDLGYTREELLSMTVFEISPSLDEAERDKVLAKVRDAGYTIMRAIHRRKDGSVFPVEVSLKCVQMDRRYIIAVCRDISERQQAEDALRESEDRYRDLVEHSEDLVCTHDLDGKLISVNPVPARLLGYEVAELLKIPMREVVAPEFREEFDAYLTRIRTAGVDKGRLMVLTRAGERRIWEYHNTLRTEGVATPIVRGMAHDVTERMQAAAALRRSEQQYRMLFERTVAGVALIAVDGRVIDCNDAWARMFGYGSAPECRGSQIADRYRDPAERELFLDELKRSGAFFNREQQLWRTDGTPFWVLLNSVLLSEGQELPLIQSTVIDISARKRAEKALRDAKEFSENLIQTANVIILGLDTDGNVNLFNDAGEEITGYSFAELKGKSWEIVVPRDRFPHVWAKFDRLMDGTAGKTYENPIITKSGEERYIEWQNSTMKVDGKIVATISFGNDVTERRRAEEEQKKAELALRVREEHFRILVEQASDGIFIADGQGKYLDANSAGAEMLGYTREEILRRSIADMVAAEELPRIADELARLEGGTTIRSEWKFRRADGSLFPGELCGKRLPDGRLQGILRDMTERNRAEETLRQSEERFRVALKDSSITVFSQDRDLRYTWIYNPHSYWQKEIIGKSDDEILGAEKARPLAELKRRVLETGAGLREEVVIPHNGTKYSFDMTIEPVLDAEHKVIGITGTSTDIARLRERADRLNATKERLAQEKLYLESEIETELGFEEIIGQSSALREVLQKARIVAPTDSTVLLLGETGTGKELVARSVHTLSPRHDQNFIKLNCAAVPSGLLESELFGHEKGAFTGAVNQKVGRLELADKGTLFLDEVGELPLELQPKLLRVLQDREFERLGGVCTLQVDVRIISATNRDLHRDVAEKKFREDLFYRLNVFPLQLPPLRDRRSDIPVLVHHFVRKHAVRMGRQIELIPTDTMRVLQNWNWPGNIRELENMIERMVILSKGQTLAPPPAELNAPQEFAEDNLTEMEREHIIRVLRETHGVLSGPDGAASRLGIKRTTLQSMLKRFDIEVEDFRRGTGTFGPD